MKNWEYSPARDLELSHRERVVSFKRESGLGGKLVYRFAWWLLRCYLFTFQRMRVKGKNLLPDTGPFILISNHSSHLDVLALCAVLSKSSRDQARPLAAADTFFTNPISSTLSAFLINALPLYRGHCGSHALASIRKSVVEYGLCPIMFPEGTRSRTGKIALFRHGIGVLVAGTAVPVVPCRIQGAFKAWPPQNRRPKIGHIEVLIGKPMYFEHIASNRQGWSKIASQLEDKVRGLAPAT
ncbi:lysophospholipid acyltransferase family protein [Thermodesulfobacteriota bacterium]